MIRAHRRPSIVLGLCAALALAGAAGCGSDTEGSGGASSATSGSGSEGGGGGAVEAATSSAASTATVTSATTSTSTASGVTACTEAAQCDDLDPCTADTCGADGRCTSSPGSFDDGDHCTIDACDPLEGETHVEYVASDGDACTMDACDPELGTRFVGDLVLFTEDFADAEGGWSVEPPWAIGPAEPSPANARGMADPESDATVGTDDDGIAGVVLGGSPPFDLEGTFYLESPEIDADVEGFVTLEYRRWLGEELANGPTVEVWDGDAWIVVWETPRDVADAPPRGEGWVRMQHDLTGVRSATLRVRFGVALGPGGANPSWNLDDVQIVRRGWAVDADACTTDSCLPSSGPRHNVVAVDDDDACTTDVCHPLAGVAHIPVACDDGQDGCCSPGCDLDPDCALPE
jgi:hypothetical protein